MNIMEKVIAKLKGQVGEELGVTDWFSVSQRDADLYSALTDDWDYMHNDPRWAKTSPWGGTIAHGMYILSLIPSFLKETTDLPIVSDSEDEGFGLNYGFDKVRFISPLPIGQPARARIRLADVTEKTPGNFLLRIEVTVSTKDKPDETVMYAENLAYLTFSGAA